MNWNAIKRVDGTWFICEGDASLHDRQEGKFEVRFFHGREAFTQLLEAYKRYYSCPEAISIWDITEGEVFLESKVIVSKDDKP